MAKETLISIIKSIALPMWNNLILTTPEIIEDGMTFDDFCDEIRMTLTF